jgi:hypothetical protein
MTPAPEAAPVRREASAGADPGDEKVFSNKLLWGYVRFLDSRLGKVATDEVLKRIGLDRLALSDFDAYSTHQQSRSLTYATMELTGEKRLSYLIGRDLPNTIGVLNGFVAGVTSPAIFMKTVGAIEMRLARKTINTTAQTGKNRFRVEITYREGFKPDAYLCENRIGCYESAPLFFGLPYAKVEHPQCLHRGEGNCVYHVEFPEHGFLVYQRIARALYLLALAGFLFAAFRPASAHAGSAALALLAAGLGFHVWYKHLSAKASLRWSLLANESLIRQNQLLDSLDTKLKAMYKAASGLIAMGGEGDPCGHTARALVMEMGFSSAQIWLADDGGQELRCVQAVGYPEEQLGLIRTARFRIGDSEDNPYGFLLQALEQRRTVIVNDIQDLMPRVSPQVREFLSALKITSFIMTPLVDGERLIGILSGEYHKGEKIESHDQILFQSLAQFLTAAWARMGNRPRTGAAA